MIRVRGDGVTSVSGDSVSIGWRSEGWVTSSQGLAFLRQGRRRESKKREGEREAGRDV